jgi:carboxymethylenebutenolidase
MGTATTITASDGFVLDAYRADPEGKPRGAVVVIQEIFGVNGHIRDVADRYAAAGYLAIAPSVFDRAERNVELGYSMDDMQKGFGYAFGKVDLNTVVTDVAATGRVAASESGGKVGIVGYCYGGLVTALSAINSGDVFAAASSYYGGNTGTLADKKPVVPMICHYGELDQHIPMSDVEKLTAAWSTSRIFVYPADHGFNCDQRASFHPQSAAIAQARTFKFFDELLG